ncbi:MAG: hypothetical protein ACLFSI_02620 [Halorhodospira sp.]
MATFTLPTGRPSTDWPVKPAVPIDGGRTERHRFTATLQRLTADELEQVRRDELDIGQLLQEHVLGWHEMYVPDVESAWSPVEFDEADADGKRVTRRFQARFQLLTASEIQALGADGDVGELLRSHVLDWSEVYDDAGNAVPFSADALDQALQSIPARGALIQTLFDVSNGVGKHQINKAERARSEPVTFSDEALDWALERMYLRNALFQALLEVSSEGPRKNSRSSGRR